MAQFNNMKLTSKGILLMNKVQTGVPLNFTKVAIGDGYLANGQTLESLTELVHKTMDLDISNIDVNSSGDGTVKIKTTLSNQNLTAGIYVREIGLYANDPDSGEILYCVANAGNTADFIPGKGSDIIENVLEVITITGNASSVTATIDQSLVFTSQKEFNEKVGDVTELSTGKVVEELKVHASHLADIASYAQYYMSSSLSVANNTDTLLDFNTALKTKPTLMQYDSVSKGVKILKAGTYEIIYSVLTNETQAQSTLGDRQMFIKLNGTTLSSVIYGPAMHNQTTNNQWNAKITERFDLAVNDILTFDFYHNIGSSVSVLNAANFTNIKIAKVG